MVGKILLNAILILLGLFLYVVFFHNRKIERAHRYTIIGFFSIVTVLIFLFMPIEIYPGYMFDFRLVPIIIGGIYGGKKVAIALFIFASGLNFYLGQSHAMICLLLNFISLLIILYVVIPKYDDYSPRKKTIVCMSFLFIATVTHFVFMFFIQHDPVAFKVLPIFIGYALAQSATVGILISTSLYIKNNAKVQKEYHQAEKLRIISELAASVSHEVRNPLTVTRGFLQLLKNNEIDPETRCEYLDLSLQELDRAQALITDYLTFAKPCEGRKPDKMFVKEELEYVEKVMQPYALMQGVKIHKLFNDDNYIIGDKQKFRQSLINILKKFN